MKKPNRSHLMQMDTAASLIAKIETYGAKFNPSNANISLQALKDNLDLNLKMKDDINDSKTNLGKYQENKNKMLLGLNLKVRQILLNLNSLGLTPETIKRVKVISKNFSYKPTKAKVPVGQEPVDSNASPGNVEAESSSSISKSSRSAYKYAERRVNWFKEFVGVIKTIPSYAPNEAELMVPALETYVQELTVELDAWKREGEKLDDLRTLRELQLTSTTDGMITLGRQAKSYIKGLFGPTSKEGKEMSKFVFIR